MLREDANAIDEDRSASGDAPLLSQARPTIDRVTADVCFVKRRAAAGAKVTEFEFDARMGKRLAVALPDRQPSREAALLNVPLPNGPPQNVPAMWPTGRRNSFLHR
jgi:hypothetical protein